MLGYSVAQDRHDGVCVITLSGKLTLATYPLIGKLIEKCLADSPAAIVIDLHGTEGNGVPLHSALANDRRLAGRQRIPLIHTAGPVVMAEIKESALHRHIEIYATLAEAVRQAQTARANPWLHVRLEPHPLSNRHARKEIGNACLAWGLPHLLEPVQLVTSELVSNAIRHAGTAIDVTASLNQDAFRIRVYDRSDSPPILREPAPFDPGALPASRGHGLRLVAAHATAWGSNRTKDGKVVWASFRLTP